MRIATWNVNSIKQRLEHLLTFLKTAVPDVVTTTGQTPYVRYGDWVVWGSALALVAAALYGRVRWPARRGRLEA